jgi:hypothetical protein
MERSDGGLLERTMLTKDWYVGAVVRKGKKASVFSRSYTWDQWFGLIICFAFLLLGLYLLATSFRGSWFPIGTAQGVSIVLFVLWLGKGIVNGARRVGS